MPHDYEVKFRDGYYVFTCTKCEHRQVQLGTFDAPNPNAKVFDPSTQQFVTCRDMEVEVAVRKIHAS